MSGREDDGGVIRPFRLPDGRGRLAEPFDDGRLESLGNSGRDAERRPIRATPWSYRDPRTIPPRQWLYGRHYVRSYVTATVAPGGLGKSSLCLVEAIAMVTGRSLLGVAARQKLRVWYWNGEDPQEETERRIAAILVHFRIPPEEVSGRLFIDSGRETSIIIAEKIADRLIVSTPVVNDLETEIRTHAIDVLFVDPFVSCHGVPENDNPAIDRVTKTFGGLADRTGCAVELVHHVRKSNPNQSEITIDDARGAVAMIGAVRSARVLNPMSKDEASKAQIASDDDRKLFFRVGTGKANMAPPVSSATWRRMVSVPLDNELDGDPGDWVGVATTWTMPGALEGVSTMDVQRIQTLVGEKPCARHTAANNWVGHAIAEALELDADTDRQRIEAVLKALLQGGALKVERVRDTKKGRDKPMVVVGHQV